MVHRQARSNSWLDDSVTRDYATLFATKFGAIERMGDGANEPRSCVAGQARIRVQSNDVANTRDRFDGVSDCRNEGRVCGSAQQHVQLVEFSALAFPSHPLLFRFIPDASSVK